MVLTIRCHAQFTSSGLFLDAIKAMAPSKGDGLHFSGLVGTTLELDAVDLTRQVLSNHAQVGLSVHRWFALAAGSSLAGERSCSITADPDESCDAYI